MAYSPISGTVPQYHVNGVPASDYVLKAYRAGLTTLLQMATNSSGSVLVDYMVLNSDGYPSVSGNIVIPHIDQEYKLALYPSLTAANANSGPIWIPDNISPSGVGPSHVITLSTLTALRNYTGVADTIILEGAAGSGDGSGGIYHFATGASAGTYSDNGTSIIVPTGGDGSEAWLLVTMANISVTQPFTTIELGHASDTTLTRSSAGVVAVEGVTIPLNSITNTHTAQQLELGHATDTTLTRLSAGEMGIEGVQVATATNTLTVSGKTLTSPTINTPVIQGGTIGTTTPMTSAKITYINQYTTATLSPTGDTAKDFGRICRITLNAVDDFVSVDVTINFIGQTTGGASTSNTSKFTIQARQKAALNNDPVSNILCKENTKVTDVGGAGNQFILPVTALTTFYTISATESYVDVYIGSITYDDLVFGYQFNNISKYGTAEIEYFNTETPIAALSWDVTSKAAPGVSVSGSYTTASLAAAGGGANNTITHGLGTDNVFVDVHTDGSVDGRLTDVAFHVGGTARYGRAIGPSISSITNIGVTGAGAGQVIFRAVNKDPSNAQTITVFYKITAG